jgi:tetratricopeptide (TPR) repeat protein
MPFEDMTYGAYDQAEQKAQMAYELYEDGKINQAIVVIDQALEINPTNIAWHFDKGLALDSVSRYDDAIVEFETALALNPSDLEILNCLAVDYTRVGLYDLAISTFEYIQQLDPNFEPSYCNRIITYAEINQHEMAEQMFYLAQQIKPDCALCYYNIGNSLFMRGKYEKAISCWKRTAQLYPTHPQINYRIAQACWALGDTANTKEHFLLELRKNAGDVDVIFDFGIFELQSGNLGLPERDVLRLGDPLESAKEKFNRIIELDPDYAKAYFYLGEIAFDNKDYEKAKLLYRQSLDKDASLVGPRYRLALCQLAEGKKSSALANLISEVGLSPDNPDVLISMGSVFLELGELDYATNCVLKALDIDAYNLQANYYLGCINVLNGRPEEASVFFVKALDIDGEHLPSLKQSAYLDIIFARFESAAEKIKKAQRLCPKDGDLKKLHRELAVSNTKEKVSDFLGRFKPTGSRADF